MRVSAWLRDVAAVAAVMTLSISLGACQKYDEEKRANMLQEQVKYYAKSIRWSNFEAAAGFIRPRHGSPPPVDFARLQDIRVMSDKYELIAATRESLEAEMIAVFTYQIPDSASVKTVTQQAKWWYDEASQRWYLEGGLPAFYQ